MKRTLQPAAPLDLRLTLSCLRHGYGDPTMRLQAGHAWRATRTPEGAASLHLREFSDRIEAEAWGAGATWALEHCDKLLGLDDDPSSLRPRHRVVKELHRRMPCLRIGASLAVVETMIPKILEQKVVGSDARRSYQQLVRRYSEPAPGPGELLLPPDPEQIRHLPYHSLHPLGVERKRADVVRSACIHARRLEEAASMPLEDAYRRLTALPGLGPWTAANVARTALGDADALIVGDYHLPHAVSWLLAGEPRSDDACMTQLLEPYRGHRGRVLRLIELSGRHAPRFGPRMRPHRIATM